MLMQCPWNFQTYLWWRKSLYDVICCYATLHSSLRLWSVRTCVWQSKTVSSSFRQYRFVKRYYMYFIYIYLHHCCECSYGRHKNNSLWMFTGETANAKAKSSENFSKSTPNFSVLGGLGSWWYKKFLQKAHTCPNPRRLSPFPRRSVDGSDPQVSRWKK